MAKNFLSEILLIWEVFMAQKCKIYFFKRSYFVILNFTRELFRGVRNTWFSPKNSFSATEFWQNTRKNVKNACPKDWTWHTHDQVQIEFSKKFSVDTVLRCFPDGLWYLRCTSRSLQRLVKLQIFSESFYFVAKFWRKRWYAPALSMLMLHF